MPRLVHKLFRGSGGETLIEVLAAILVASMSVALMFSCIMASSESDKAASGHGGDTYYAALAGAETHNVTVTPDPYPASPQVVIGKYAGPADAPYPTIAPQNITIYGGEGVYSYTKG